RTCPGNFTLTSGTLVMNATAGNLRVGGNWTNSGTFNQDGRVLILIGSGTQVITRTSGAETFTYLALSKTGGSVLLASNLALTAPTGGNALEFNGTTDVLDLNGKQLTLTSTVGGSDANGSLKGSTLSKMAVNGTGALGTLRFTAGAQSLASLTLSRTSAGSMTLGTPLTVSGTLTLTDGVVNTGASTLALAAGATLSRTNGFVAGNLQKVVPTGAAALSFEVGSGTTYAPVDVAFGSVT